MEGTEDMSAESQIHFKDRLESKEEVVLEEDKVGWRVPLGALPLHMCPPGSCKDVQGLSHPWKSDAEIRCASGWMVFASKEARGRGI